jgi:hypothetical protein
LFPGRSVPIDFRTGTPKPHCQRHDSQPTLSRIATIHLKFFSLSAAMSAPDHKQLAKTAMEVQKLLNLTCLTLAPLEADLNEAIKQWQKNQLSQFWSRTVFRCLCAAVEARLFAFRKMATKLGSVNGVQFNAKELEILAEQRMVTSNVGLPVVKPKFLQFPDAVKESFRLFAKSVAANIRVNFGDVGFSSLCKTFEIRNRLMHPKGPFDVQVSAKDIDAANQAVAWFNATYMDVFDQCRKSIEERIARMKGQVT